MATDESDLWPADLVVDVRSPIMILNEQAEALSKRTKGIVKGEVVSGVSGRFEQPSFDLVAPAVGVRHRILRVRYSKELPYPVVLIAGPLQRNIVAFADQPDFATPAEWNLAGDEAAQARLAHTPNEVREFLKTIFNAPTSRATLFSLVARSNEVIGAVRSPTEEAHENSKPN
jgi:hypothetical protein